MPSSDDSRSGVEEMSGLVPKTRSLMPTSHAVVQDRDASYANFFHLEFDRRGCERRRKTESSVCCDKLTNSCDEIFLGCTLRSPLTKCARANRCRRAP